MYHQGCLNALLLQSLYLEACGDNAKLLEFHKQILEDDENNEAILKRQVRPKGTLALIMLICFHIMLHVPECCKARLCLAHAVRLHL